MRDLYTKLNAVIDKINFSDLWEGFHRFDFALYNNEEIFLKDEIIPWNENFLGNTAIEYNDQIIAIWKVEALEGIDIDVLTSKLIHEMFHAYQKEMNEKRWPDENEAIFKYEYSIKNLTIKFQENLLLKSLIKNFKEDDFKEFLSMRAYRKDHFPYEFIYETNVEVIEGMAEYIETKALALLDEKKYNAKIERLASRITNKENLLPIRMISYDIGALVCLVAEKNNINFSHKIGSTDSTVDEMIARRYNVRDYYFINEDQDIKRLIKKHNQENEDMIFRYLIKCNHNLTDLNYQLAGFDPYNARAFNNKLYCPGFLAYLDESKNLKIINETCVVDVDKNYKIDKIHYHK